jgi:beta-N-acetylhexosaminidase
VGSFVSEANWLVFSILNLDDARAGADALKRLLAEQPELLYEKKVVVFGFNDPFYLDATDLASIDAYYCLYSKTTDFVETAARLLFQEITPKGHAPVSIPVVGYNLIEMTYPDPQQIISLEINVEELPDVKQAESQLVGLENIYFRVGDALPIQTGIILDRNGLPVPDGTVVYFMIDHFAETEQSTIYETETNEGMASMSYLLQSFGRVEIRAQSDPAKNSEIFVLDITSEEGGLVSEITPTPMPTLVNLNEWVGQTAANGQNGSVPDEPLVPIRGTIQWFLSTIVILGLAYFIYLIAQRFFSLVSGATIALLAVMGGYSCLMWFQVGLPGSFVRYDLWDVVSLLLWVALFTLAGSLVGAATQAQRLKATMNSSEKAE